MIDISLYQWKQVTEGLARGVIGPFGWKNVPLNGDSLRCYLDGETVVAEMRIADCNTDKPSYECNRTYKADQALLDATAFIYIPTDEDYQIWDDLDLNYADEIAKIEAG